MKVLMQGLFVSGFAVTVLLLGSLETQAQSVVYATPAYSAPTDSGTVYSPQPVGANDATNYHPNAPEYSTVPSVGPTFGARVWQASPVQHSIGRSFTNRRIAQPFYYSSPRGVARRIPGQTVPVQTMVANFAPPRSYSSPRQTSFKRNAWGRSIISRW